MRGRFTHQDKIMNTKLGIETPRESSRGHGQRRQSIESILRKHPFLEGMSPHQLRLLSDCAIPQRFAAQEVIFREGEPANRFYLIQSGKVGLESYTLERGNKVIEKLGPGEVFGWSWLFPPYYWHFNARALKPTETIFFHAVPLREECESDHDLGYELMKRMAGLMMKRLQVLRKQLLPLACKL
jgi:CRP-like cAMP-binding protein